MVNNFVVVLGMHRSGTSTITRSLEALGVSLGDNLLAPAPDNNEKGFFEDVDIMQLNDAILAKFDCSWDAPFTLNDLNLTSGILHSEFTSAVYLLQTKTAPYARYAIKDPRICVLLPFWKRVFSALRLKPLYIVALRHPENVAKSLTHRDGIPVDEARNLWIYYNNMALTHTSTEKRIIVEYDDIIDSPEAELKKMAEFLKVTLPKENSAEYQSFCKDFLSKNLRHHKPIQTCNTPGDSAEILYEAMRQEALYGSTQNTELALETIDISHETSLTTERVAINAREPIIDVDFFSFSSSAPNTGAIVKIENTVRKLRFLKPTRHTKKSLEKIGIFRADSLESAKILTKKHRFISIDFFDTIVQRKIDPPEILKKKTAEFTSLRLLDLGIYIHPDRLLAIRNHFENELRQESKNIKGLDHEASIQAIFYRILKAISCPTPIKLCKELIEFEVSTELCALQLQPGIIDFLEDCKNNNVKLVVTSDMYLRGKDIKKLISHFNIGRFFDSVIVSSDYGLTKHSGNLFSITKAAFDDHEQEILHLGDNILSDIHSANTNGLAAAWLYEQNNLLRRLKLQSKNSLTEIKSISRTTDSRKYFKLSLEKIAPAVVYFCYKALYDAHKLGIRKLLFISREGIFLKEIFKTLQSEVTLFSQLDSICLETIYASRISSIAGAYQGHSTASAIDTLIRKTINRQHQFSITNFLDVFDVPEDIAPRLDKEVTDAKTAFSKLFVYFQSEAGKRTHKHLEEKRLIFSDYLLQFGVKDEPFGLVDVGWGGTIQEHIALTIKHNKWNTKAFGFYLGSNSLSNCSFNTDCISRIFPGYVINENDQDIRTILMTKAMPLLETCFTDPSIGTTIGYNRNNEKILPILEKKNDGNEVIYQETLEASLHYANKFSAVVNLYVLNDAAIRHTAREQLLQLMTNPTCNEATMFQSTEFDFGWGEKSNSPLINEVKITDLISPQKLMHRLTASGWWQGSLAASHLGAFNILLHWYIYLRSKNLRIIDKIKKILKINTTNTAKQI